MTATTQHILSDSNLFPGIKEPVIQRYFETFNAGDFAAAADLFDGEGVLNAPFEEPVVGRSAIADYLTAEAVGMQLYPHQENSQTLAGSCLKIQVSGKVKTSIFTVNLGWLFVLNPQQKILDLTVKLLASPQELLKLRSRSKSNNQ
ncbi:MAG: nuclear transport factor 2 family protein [Microcoleus sp.]